MEYFALVLLILFCLAGFTAIFFTTIGTLIVLIGTVVYAVMTGFDVLPLNTLIIILTLYLCGEVLEYVCIVLGAKRFGASNKAALGALIGGFLGAIGGIAIAGIGPFLGALLGIFSGAFLVEYSAHKDLRRALKAGAGGVVGRFSLIIVKICLVSIMFVLVFSRIIGYYRR